MYEEQPFNGMFHRNKAIRHADILDGTSNTIALGERASMFAPNGWAGVIPVRRRCFRPRLQLDAVKSWVKLRGQRSR